MAVVAGVDSSTQSCKVLVVDADTGAIVRDGRAGHPDGTEVDPAHWVDALDAATSSACGIVVFA
jgi:xylulokinase